MSTGTIEWAATNLSGYQTFAPNATDYGALFQWGYDNALTYQTSTTDGWHTTAYAGTDWNGGQGPCPAGWRLPTLAEINNLLNLAATNTVTPSPGTASGTWTITSWTTGASGGATIKPKAGDTTKTLRLPNAGYRQATGTATGQDTYAEYWSSTPNGTDAYRLSFNPSYLAGQMSALSKLYAWPVRCVRTVE
jgi:uncharacterized protein (TIGR02145 family)